MEKLFDLTGKVAVVTGAGGVLCSEMAKALYEMGAIDEESLKTILKQVKKH